MCIEVITNILSTVFTEIWSLLYNGLSFLKIKSWLYWGIFSNGTLQVLQDLVLAPVMVTALSMGMRNACEPIVVLGGTLDRWESD